MARARETQVIRPSRLLHRGEPTGRKDNWKTHPKPPRMEATLPTTWKPANTERARPRKPWPGGAEPEKQKVSWSACFPKSEGRHHRWNGKNWPIKRGAARQCLRPGTENPCRVRTPQENSQARFIQLDTTSARRNQPVTGQSILRQAPRGRGKTRPAQARWKPTARKV